MAELRDDYKEKVRAFTNIIEICLSESKRKEEHWRLQAGVSPYLFIVLLFIVLILNFFKPFLFRAQSSYDADLL